MGVQPSRLEDLDHFSTELRTWVGTPRAWLRLLLALLLAVFTPSRPFPASHPVSLPGQVLTTGNYLNMPVGLNVISTSGPGSGNLLTANGGAGTLVEITPNTASAPGVQVGLGSVHKCAWT